MQTTHDMKIIYNKLIPLKGFYAINLFGVLFVRGNKPPTDKVIKHESVHTQQMKEMLYIFFYVWYVIEWLIKGFIYSFNIRAYLDISFEQEARYWQIRDEIARKHFGWCKYIFKSKINKNGTSSVLCLCRRKHDDEQPCVLVLWLE